MHVLDVAARTKGVASTGEDRGADRFVALDIVTGCHDRFVFPLGGQRIARLRGVQCDNSDALLLLKLNEIRHYDPRV